MVQDSRKFSLKQLQEMDRRFEEFRERHPDLTREELYRIVRGVYQTHKTALQAEPEKMESLVDKALAEVKECVRRRDEKRVDKPDEAK